MEEFKFSKKGSKTPLNIILTLLGGILALGGYGFYANGVSDFAVIFWLLAAVMVGLIILVNISNVRLYHDRLEIRTLIKKTIYFKNVSTIDAKEYNIVFKNSSGKVLAAITLQFIGSELSAMLSFIDKHNPHIQLGPSFIPEAEFNDMLEKAIENEVLDIIEELPEDKE